MTTAAAPKARKQKNRVNNKKGAVAKRKLSNSPFFSRVCGAGFYSIF